MLYRQSLVRLAGIAIAACLPASVIAGPDESPPVRIFEGAPPSVDQLRSILVPESRSRGLSRRIEIPRRDAISGPSPAQPANAPADAAGASATTAGGSAGAAPEPAGAATEGTEANAVGAAPVTAGSSAAGSVGFRINFALNSATVPPSYYPYVDQIGELLRQEPRIKLLIEGHTDATGSDAYNLELSRRRAFAVAEYLIRRQEIDPGRLLVAGKGKREPLLDDPYDARNRRVQFVRAE